MHSKARFHSPIFGMGWSPASVVVTTVLALLFLTFLILLITLTAQSAHGQTYHVIHHFTGGADSGIVLAG